MEKYMLHTPSYCVDLVMANDYLQHAYSKMDSSHCATEKQIEQIQEIFGKLGLLMRDILLTCMGE